MDNDKIITKIGRELSEDFIKRFGKKLNSIILYGSYARGDNQSDSDMDIMVLFDCDTNEIKEYFDDVSMISSDISLNNDILVSITYRDLTTFKKNLNILPFYQNIVNEGVVLYGTIEN